MNTSDDSFAVDGVLSLREAVAAANSNNPIDGFSGDPGVDVIQFDPVLSGVPIEITQGEIRIDESLTIQGSGAQSTLLRGNSQSRLLVFSDTTGAQTYSIDGVTLERGFADSVRTHGGAIQFHSENNSLFRLRNSFLQNNQATEVGGAVHLHNATVHIDASTFANNSARNGGGLALGNSRSVVTNSTFTQNSGSVSGGGIDQFSRATGTLDLINVTLVENDAPHGRNVRNGAENGVSTIRYGNTIMTGGVGTAGFRNGQFGDFATAEAISLGNNLVDSGVDSGKLPSDFHIYDQWMSLQPLGYYGGDVPTRALPPLSLAVDRGSNALAVGPGADAIWGTGDDVPLLQDQRGDGFSRLRDGGSGTIQIDVGAFENQDPVVAPRNLIVNSIGDVKYDSSPPELSQLTIREAVDIANLQPGPNVITFSQSLRGQTIILPESAIVVTDSVSIEGPGADQLTIDGNDNSRLFWCKSNLEDDVVFSISGVTLSGGKSPGVGGAILMVKHHLKLEDSVIRDNEAWVVGGGISVNRGTAEISNTLFTNNTVTGKGGAIHFADSSGIIQAVQVIGNSATEEGGGMFARSRYDEIESIIQIVDSSFDQNISTPLGDLYVDSTAENNQVQLTVQNSIFLSKGAPWQHPLQNADVNNDQLVTPSDALFVINALATGIYNVPGSADLLSPDEFEVFPDRFVDVNGDDQISPLDALNVINDLARQLSSSAPQIVARVIPSPADVRGAESMLFEQEEDWFRLGVVRLT